MKFIEKLKQDNPNMTEEELDEAINSNCPDAFGYEDNTTCTNETGIKDECRGCWNREMLKTEEKDEPSCDDVKDAYNQGLNDAWEFVKKTDTSRSPEECMKMLIFFGVKNYRDIFEKLTPQEAIAKLKTYEDSKIEVGDVVIHEETGMKFLIITHEKGDFYKFGVIDLEKMTLDKIANNTSAFKKTGKHIDIQSILEELKGE